MFVIYLLKMEDEFILHKEISLDYSKHCEMELGEEGVGYNNDNHW